MGKLRDKISNLCNKVAGWFREHQDKVLHFLGGAGITILASFIPNCAPYAIIASFIAAFGKEFIDEYKTPKSWDWYDFLATIIGGVIAQALIWMYIFIL